MILRIGGCEIDCDRRQVLRDGAEQRLPRKAFDLLLVLLEKRPKVVAKDVLNSQGRVASLGLADKVAEAGAIYTFVKPNAPQLADLVAMVDAGKIRIDVQQTFALSDVAAAVELAEQKRTHGKLVLLP